MAYNAVVEAAKQVVRQHPLFGPVVGRVRTEKRSYGRAIRFTLVAPRPALIKLASLEDALKRAGIRSLGVDFRFKQNEFGTSGCHFLVLHIRLDD